MTAANLRKVRVDYPTHQHCGSDTERQSVGLPGHCERCAEVGHVKAHRSLGCSDVGCDSDHMERQARPQTAAAAARSQVDAASVIALRRGLHAVLDLADSLDRDARSAKTRPSGSAIYARNLRDRITKRLEG